MNNDIEETANEGEGDFNFDAWVHTNNLAEIKDLFIKHNATTPQTLTFTSQQFKNLMVDPQLFAKSHMIPRICDAMPKQRVVIAEDEEIAMEEMKDNLRKAKDVEKELDDLKERMKDIKLREIEQTKNKINKSFRDLKNALNVKKENLLFLVQQMEQQQENENDVLSNCAKDLRSERRSISKALQICNNMIDCGINKNRKKRKEDIKKIAKDTNDKFNRTKNEINKNVEIVQKMNVKINFEINNKKYEKILNTINGFGIIVNKENKLNNEWKEDGDELKIKKLEKQLAIKNEEFNSFKRMVTNSLSFEVDSKYRWHFENDEKENNINVGTIDDQQKSIKLIDGNIRNILQNSVSTKPANSVLHESIRILQIFLKFSSIHESESHESRIFMNTHGIG